MLAIDSHVTVAVRMRREKSENALTQEGKRTRVAQPKNAMTQEGKRTRAAQPKNNMNTRPPQADFFGGLRIFYGEKTFQSVRYRKGFSL